jgi:vanillate O-demethylase monooxygenase subunit
MSQQSSSRNYRTEIHPRNCWYAVATSEEVGREPLGRRVLGTGVVLFRTTDGTAVALEDRCAHRPYPLSLGRVDGDRIVSGYTGFTYDARGFCVHVPTQSEIPVGARVRAFPLHEDGVFVWVWLGEPAMAGLRRPPATPWLSDPGWATSAPNGKPTLICCCCMRISPTSLMSPSSTPISRHRAAQLTAAA